jgi:tetratricopeptide (TPR) repeat protein
MSLLIKALDKAQEEAQTAKGKKKAKQSQADAQLANNTEHKRQPTALSLTPAQPHLNSAYTKSNAASEKISAANALELELSPNIKADLNAVDTQKLANDNLPADSVSKAFAPSKDKAVNAADANTNTSKIDTANTDASKTSAANVFAAKRIEANHQNFKLAFIVGVGVIVLSVIGAYFYQPADSGSDSTFLAQRPLMPAPSSESAKESDQLQLAEKASLSENNSSRNITSTSESSETLAAEVVLSDSKAPQNNTDAFQAAPNKLAKARSAINTLRLAKNEKAFDGFDSESQPIRPLKKTDQFEADRASTAQIASKSASIRVSKTTEQSVVNPVLMRAYDAYNAGNDTDAIKLYKQVLQRDMRNVDALLGLGAIAQRQGRLHDANGWYGKVLELEPKNTIALNFSLAENLDNQAPTGVNNESLIKNMLAKQPDDASLYATLGNFYADSNQWSSAQQAYFDAYRLNASADNAFNLAISLDQLSKPKLALPYYQLALQLSQKERTTFDKAALEARISAIQ